MAVIRALALALFLGLSAAPAAECDAAANSTAACRELGCVLSRPAPQLELAAVQSRAWLMRDLRAQVCVAAVQHV